VRLEDLVERETVALFGRVFGGQDRFQLAD
jgi:hypothetical protein